MATLNAAFKKIFGEALAPHGFVKIKGGQPYLVRVVEGGEIIHVVTCMLEPGISIFKEFVIVGGVATVYRPSIDLKISPSRNSNWFTSNLGIYRKLNPFKDNSELTSRISRFSYGKGEEAMLNELKYSLEITKEIMLPMFDKITTLEKCIENKHIIKMDINIFDDENFGNQYSNNYYNEGLLLIKTDNHDDFIERNQKQLNVIGQQIKMGKDFISYEKAVEIFEECRIRKTTNRDNIYNNPELYKRALSELEKRKAVNTETLRSYGLEL